MIDRYLLTFLLNAIWQIPLVAGVAASGCWLLRNAPARHRHVLWTAALAASVILPSISVWNGLASRQTIAVPTAPVMTGPAQLANAPAKESTQTPAPVRTVALGRTTGNILLAAWLLFLAYRALRLIRAGWATVRISRSASHVPAGTQVSHTWKRCAAAFGRSDIALKTSTLVSGPVASGSSVILPEAMLTSSSNVLATAIGHEMAHIVRRDFGLNLLYEVLRAPVAFHPAAAWIRREIDRTREMACDELVTERLLEPRVYANSILEIAAGMSALRQPGYTLGVFDGDILEARIRRLLERPAAGLRRARLVLTVCLSALVLGALAASGLAVSALAQSAAVPEMKLAAEGYNYGDYAVAVQHFDHAVALDPNNMNARIFLANALIRESIAQKTAGKTEADPLLMRARQQYQEVLRQEPRNLSALFGVASLNSPSQAGESHALILKAIEIDPKNKNAYYTAAVLDWQLAYPAISSANQNLPREKVYSPIADANVRASLRTQYLPRIEEGYRMLQIASELDPQWSDPMAYMNLLYRLQAALADTQAESDALVKQADGWVGKALAARRTGGPQSVQPLDVDAPPPLAIPSAVPPPPPPPPPPPGQRGNGDHR